MKMTIEKRVEFVIDTDKERKRITKAFRNDHETQRKLIELMNMIECEKWEAALQALEGDWWQGRDEKHECPRLEFVGMVNTDSPHMDRWMSYMDLVYMFYNRPNVYKVVKTS